MKPVEFVAQKIHKVVDDTIGNSFFLNDIERMLVKQIEELSEEKHNSYLRVKLSIPYKRRTTGEESQNHHINGHVRQLCAYTGEDFETFKYEAKKRAIKRGYPFYTDRFGNAIPYSERDINTVQAGYLIEQLHEDAAFLGIILKEREEDENSRRD